MSAREALREMRERAEAIDEPGLDSNQYREALESSAADLPALVGALEAVLEKHRDYDGRCDECSGIEFQPYPCATVRAIETALEGR